MFPVNTIKITKTLIKEFYYYFYSIFGWGKKSDDDEALRRT
jgi:hypothetical protein